MNHNSYYMYKALKLAKKGLFTTAANPRVGCVLVSRGHVVGTGYHKRVGEPHAEVFAIESADDFVEGATAFVTLEPCSHFGKNPPCADVLIQAKVKKVIICNIDPNPLVAGKGIAKLKAAGIKVKTSKLSQKGQQLNIGFFHRMKTGLPFVRLKMAQSMDGRTAMASGESYWITGEKARSDVQYWRARSQAILTGIETVLQDDCRLTVRPNDLPKKYRSLPHDFDKWQPMRVVLDSHLRIDPDAKILQGLGRKIIITAKSDFDKIKQLQNQGAEVVVMPTMDATKDNKINLKAVLKWLGEQQVNELLVETGATLAGSFIQQKLVNQLIIYTAPVLMGSSARPLFELDIEQMQNRIAFKDYKIKSFGEDWRLIANLE
ncbi:MAG: bifunctional diaminohydroxyphosphoribosylaminopyrimidine deaminase/5-amino-6-(5-phosphoribosylamino)uracil reductase RibD [Proteobacteria bacterium]|nr:bifunctional diaminohydroxyphosphoribosylaminopyrimidine deaminase/5-amino-6-(5-phosphoribosylamino)uracil reductase RibD [Pseudomonadota bacterium]